MYRISYLLLCLLLFGTLDGQVPAGGGLIVNEINQGGSGVKEFMEFLVLGDPANPCSPVDLSGWVFDDNNGSFESCGAGVGIATGHYRFTSCYNAVPPGALLVVYNTGDVYAGMPAADPLDADGDLVYIIPSNSTCLEANYTQPVSSPALCTYGGSYAAPTITWAAGMANSGDVSQTRKPDFSFFHGFSFGDVTTIFPPWPTGASAGTSFNLSGGNMALDCGSCWKGSSYITTTAGAGTPGVPNTLNNSFFIDNLRNCLLNYTDLDDPDNCALILDLQLIEISAIVSEQDILLSFQHSNPDAATATFEWSSDQSAWTVCTYLEDVSDTQQTYSFPFYPSQTGTYYFRVKMVLTDGTQVFSNTVPVNHRISFGSLYPNPATASITIPAAEPAEGLRVEIHTTGGQVVARQVEITNDVLRLYIGDLPPGMYRVVVSNVYEVYSDTFIKL